MSQTKV
jgi:putative intracellular protease/amidase